jgi:hypothetical protein
MKNTAVAVFFLAFLASSVGAQFVSPVPVAEREVRDGTSTKMRSLELDRVKREAGINPIEKFGPAAVNNFLEIKQDFEKIQVLDGNIVRVYMRGKVIEYARIAAFSAELGESAARLKKNLFSLPDEAEKDSPKKTEEDEKPLPNDVKNLIVELDNTIGAFVGNPIFTTSKKSGREEKEKARGALERLIYISEALKQEAEKQTQATK